jgi:hypothetical protein
MFRGRNVRMLRKEANFVSIPVEMAIYCENCETVSNSSRDRCGVCGSQAILSLVRMIDGPPTSPGSGPAVPTQVVPIDAFERTPAASRQGGSYGGVAALGGS